MLTRTGKVRAKVPPCGRNKTIQIRARPISTLRVRLCATGGFALVVPLRDTAAFVAIYCVQHAYAAHIVLHCFRAKWPPMRVES